MVDNNTPKGRLKEFANDAVMWLLLCVVLAWCAVCTMLIVAVFVLHVVAIIAAVMFNWLFWICTGRTMYPSVHKWFNLIYSWLVPF